MLNKSSKEFGFTLKRIKVPKYMAKTVADDKLLLKRIVSENLKEQQKFETDASCNPDIDLSLLEKKNNEISDTSINSECTESDVISPRTLTSILKKGKSPYGEKSVNFFGKTKNQKIIPQKKFKVSKVTWGPVPSKAKKTPRKARLKGENKADKENTDKKEAEIQPEVKVPKKRGRKPKVKVEITIQSALDEEEKKEVIEKEKPKRGRKPKIKPPVQTQVKEEEPKTEIKTNTQIQSPPQSKGPSAEPQSTGLKRSRKG